MLSIVAVVGIMAALVYIGFTLALYQKSKSMRRKEERMNELGIAPYGSGLCHGMVVDETNKRAVKSDSKKSSAWYGRLA